MPVQLNKIPLLIILALFFIGFACTDEESEPRTREKEWEELNAYIRKLENEGYVVDTTDLSVFYIIKEKGTGETPQVGDNCTISYTGRTLSGRKFEDSKDIFDNGMWNFKYKPSHKVEGFVNTIKYMNRGAKFEMYIHSDYAYGAGGGTGVPPFTTVVYKVEMIDISKLGL